MLVTTQESVQVLMHGKGFPQGFHAIVDVLILLGGTLTHEQPEQAGRYGRGHVA